MSRQQAFEAIYAKQHDVPAESLVQYRFDSKEGYSLPGIASHYRFYCLAMDSIVVEMPNRFDEKYQDYYDDVEGGCFNECRYINDVHAALTAAGVKYK